MDPILNLLSDFCITGRYRGYRRLYCVLTLALENEDRLESIVKELYIPAAQMTNCSRYAVEHSIRTVIEVAFKRNPQLMDRVMGYQLTESPCASDFIAAAVAHLQRHASATV